MEALQRLRRLGNQLLAPGGLSARPAAATEASEVLRTINLAVESPSEVLSPEEDARRWREYCEKGTQRASELKNRGPACFDAEGRLAPDILEAYFRTGFYVFEGVLKPEEIADLRSDWDAVLENAPTAPGNLTDKHGEPVRFPEYYNLAIPLNKSWVPPGALKPNPSQTNAVVGLMYHPLCVMDSALRLYGHPTMLRVAECILGPDFVPFTENVFYKAAGEGPATVWHQDGRTHWGKDGGWAPTLTCHGFSFHAAVTRCTAENGLWFVEETAWRQQDIPGLIAAGGDGARLPNAVPMLMQPGDIGLQNRSALHGAFPNKSPETRLTFQYGFHPRDKVVGFEVRNTHASPRQNQVQMITYDEAWVQKRARMIPVAIDARRQRYPAETPYVYQPTVGQEEAYRWNEQTRETIVKEYWRNDITL